MSKAIEKLMEEAHAIKDTRERSCAIDALKATAGYESIKSEETGRDYAATGILRAMRNRGIIGAVLHYATGSRGSAAFEYLRSHDAVQYSFESVAIRHKNLFPGDVIAKAQERVDAPAPRRNRKAGARRAVK